MIPQNPFRPATPTRLFLKLGVFGDTGTGKTILALSATELGKVCIIDLEASTSAYYGDYTFDVLPSQSYKELENALIFLQSGDHDYSTVILDPCTVLYESIQNSRTRFRNKGVAEGDAGKMDVSDWGAIKRIYKSIMVRIVNLQMNVIMTFREKEKVDFSDIEKPVNLGTVFDGEKSTPYYLDLWGRMVVAGDGEDAKYVYVVKKSRFPELANQKILIPYQHGFKKLYDLCRLTWKNEKAIQASGGKSAAPVKYEVDSTDIDAALKKPEVVKPPVQIDAESKAKEVVEAKMDEPTHTHTHDTSSTEPPVDPSHLPTDDHFLNAPTPANDRSAMKKQLAEFFGTGEKGSVTKNPLFIKFYKEWCDITSSRANVDPNLLGHDDFMDMAEHVITKEMERRAEAAPKPAPAVRAPRKRKVADGEKPVAAPELPLDTPQTENTEGAI
jgi:hypothetical protein